MSSSDIERLVAAICFVALLGFALALPSTHARTCGASNAGPQPRSTTRSPGRNASTASTCSRGATTSSVW